MTASLPFSFNLEKSGRDPLKLRDWSEFFATHCKGDVSNKKFASGK